MKEEKERIRNKKWSKENRKISRKVSCVLGRCRQNSVSSGTAAMAVL
jgi:hypothetical protein